MDNLQKKYSDAINKFAQCNREKEEAVLLLRQVRLLDPSVIGGMQVLKMKIKAFLDDLDKNGDSCGKMEISEN